MNKGKMVFSQIMDFASQDAFKRCVERYKGNYKSRGFTCWKQFLFLAFGQLTHRESMSDTIMCLGLNNDKLYHLGIGRIVNKSTLSRANENRDWRIFEEFGLKLIEQAKALYQNDNQLDINLKGDVFALDSTTVDLCLEIFWWATFRTTKAAIKIHTLLDLKTSIPDYIYISEGNVHDVNILDHIEISKGGYYVMDKAYIDFERLYRIKKEKGYFVVRAKDNMKYRITKRRSPDRKSGILSDQNVILDGFYSKQNYPEEIRKIKFYDSEYKRTFIFITNNFKLKATTVAKLYKQRWGIELFFKWIKQHLKIKSFWGHNENSVKIQIWVAISVYVLVAIARKKLKINHTLYEMLQFISVSPFEKKNLFEVFNELDKANLTAENATQLKIRF